MTVGEVEYRVAQLANMDNEMAHLAEDALHQDVLNAIAFGETEWALCRALAAAALKSKDVNFSRWYA